MRSTIKNEFIEHLNATEETMNSIINEIEIAANICIDSLKNGGKILLMGNGGSAADSQHIAAELVGRYKIDRKGLPAIALTTDSSAITSIANDFGYDKIFEQQIESLANQLNLAAICLSETKLDDNVHESFFHIPGYNIELKHRTRRGGGVCIYIRDDIPFVRVNKLENKNLEHISVDITIRGKKINLNVVYRPPSRNTPNQSAIEEDAAFLQNIETTLSKIRSHRSSTKIVCGDMNFGDCYNCYEGLPGKQLDDKAAPLFLENNFYQLIDIPTRKFNMSVSLFPSL